MKKNTLYNGSSLQWLRENKSNLKQISFFFFLIFMFFILSHDSTQFLCFKSISNALTKCNSESLKPTNECAKPLTHLKRPNYSVVLS